MRIVSVVLALVAVLVCGVPAAAQTNASGSSVLAFDQPASTLAEAQAYTYRVYPDGLTTGTVVSPVTCAGTTSPFVCQLPFPAFTPGAHSVTVTAANTAGESLKSTPFAFIFVVLPQAPTNVRKL